MGASMTLQPLHSLKILVVEDDADSLDLVTFSLASKGAVVEGALTAGAAIAIVNQRVPDLLVTDLELPDGDGCTLLRQLRASPGVARLPAVALTGYATTSVAEKVRSAGFESLLTKPVSLAELTEVLAALAGREGPPVAAPASSKPVQ